MLQIDEALLSWIQQHAPYGIITLDPDFCIRRWNHWMEFHCGMGPADVLGKRLGDLFPEFDERKLLRPLERALTGESSVLSTSLHRHFIPLPSPLREAAGALMRQTARVSPLHSEGAVSGILIVIEDVTQREIQAEALQRQHRRDEILSWALSNFLSGETRKTIRPLFFKIAEHLDFDTFCIYLRDSDTDKLTLYATGGMPKELEAQFAECPLLTAVAQGTEGVTFNSIRTHDEPGYALFKQAHTSCAIAIPLVANDRKLGLLCYASGSRETIAADESQLLTVVAQYLAVAVDRENTNRQLNKAREQIWEHSQLLERRVEERTARLKETVSELETLSYTLAHDLKAPVRGMQGYCQVLLEDFGDSLPAEARLIIQKMARSPKRMDDLIRDLLEFNQVSRAEVVLSRVDILPLLENILAMRSPSVRQAVVVEGELLPVVAHRALLQQVLSNLVDNAFKFIAPDIAPRIVIRTELVQELSPSTRSTALLFSSVESGPSFSTAAWQPAKAPHVRLWVEDNGIGIPAEAHPKIFGIFERGLNAHHYEGTGMGLAIVARAIQRMHGSCGVKSAAGSGSRFWVELPPAEPALMSKPSPHESRSPNT